MLLTVERRSSGDDLVDCQPQRVEIAPRVTLSEQLLGRHVPHRPDLVAGRRHVFSRIKLCQSEIGDQTVCILSISRLDGLMSRCKIPCSCACANASATCRPTSA